MTRMTRTIISFAVGAAVAATLTACHSTGATTSGGGGQLTEQDNVLDSRSGDGPATTVLPPIEVNTTEWKVFFNYSCDEGTRQALVTVRDKDSGATLLGPFGDASGAPRIGELTSTKYTEQPNVSHALTFTVAIGGDCHWTVEVDAVSYVTN